MIEPEGLLKALWMRDLLFSEIVDKMECQVSQVMTR